MENEGQNKPHSDDSNGDNKTQNQTMGQEDGKDDRQGEERSIMKLELHLRKGSMTNTTDIHYWT